MGWKRIKRKMGLHLDMRADRSVRAFGARPDSASAAFGFLIGVSLLMCFAGCASGGGSDPEEVGAEAISCEGGTCDTLTKPEEPTKSNTAKPKPVSTPTPTPAPVVNVAAAPLPKMLINIVTWGPGVAEQVNAAVPEMRREWREVQGVELDLRFFDIGDPLPVLMPRVDDPLFTRTLRKICGSAGGMLVVTSVRMDYKLANGHDVQGLSANIGCWPDACHAWAYVGPYSAIEVLGNLMAYEVGHLLGTAGGQDIILLAKDPSLKTLIKIVNAGGYLNRSLKGKPELVV